jgi:hypothetical protein
VLPTWVGDQPLPQELQTALQCSQLLMHRQEHVGTEDGTQPKVEQEGKAKSSMAELHVTVVHV